MKSTRFLLTNNTHSTDHIALLTALINQFITINMSVTIAQLSDSRVSAMNISIYNTTAHNQQTSIILLTSQINYEKNVTCMAVFLCFSTQH